MQKLGFLETTARHVNVPQVHNSIRNTDKGSSHIAVGFPKRTLLCSSELSRNVTDVSHVSYAIRSSAWTCHVARNTQQQSLTGEIVVGSIHLIDQWVCIDTEDIDASGKTSSVPYQSNVRGLAIH